MTYEMTPLAIRVILHYYAHADDFENMESDSFKNVAAWFRADGYLVQQEPNQFGATLKMTDKGLCYARAILRAVSQVQPPEWSCKILKCEELE